VCQLARSHPDIFKQIHELVLEQQVSQTQTAKIVNNKAVELSLSDYKPLNAMNMSGHFRYHIALEERAAAALTKYSQIGDGGVQPTPLLVAVSPEAGASVDSMVHRQVGTELKDYNRLESLYEDLNEKLAFVSTYINEIKDKSEAAGSTESPIDLDLIMAYQKLAAETRAIIGDINKVRQGSKLVTMVVQSLLESMMQDMMRQMSELYNSHNEALISIGIEESKSLKMSHEMKIRSAEIMANVARSAVDEVLKSYKIKVK
jgi:hypothetical protein